MTVVDCFGLHIAPGGIPFLHQQDGGWCAINPNIGSPFTVLSQKRRCPHRFPRHLPSVSPIFRDWFNEQLEHHPLFEWMQPVPKEPHEEPVWIETERFDRPLPLLGNLMRLSCPVSPQMHFIDYVTEAQIDTYLKATNLGPLVLLGIKPKHTELVHRLRQLSFLRPRRLGFVGDEHTPHRMLRVRLSEMPAEFIASDYEKLGAHIVHAQMKGQFHGCVA